MTGMLWFCDNPKDAFQKRVQDACAYFEKSRGLKPTTVYVNPMENIEGEFSVNIKAWKYILPNHMIVGVE